MGERVQRAPAGSREGPSPRHIVPIDGLYTAVPPVCESQARARRSYDAKSIAGSPESRTTEEAGQVAAPGGAGAESYGARAWRRDGGGKAPGRASADRHSAGWTAELGTASLRVSHVPAPRCTRSRRRPGRDCQTAAGDGRESECRVPLELAPRAAAHSTVGCDLRRQTSAARRDAPRRRRQSDRRRHAAHRGRRRQHPRARAAAPLRRGRQRHSGRRAAARLHDVLGHRPGRTALAARARRRSESGVGSRRRDAAARRGAALGRADGRDARAARRRSRSPPYRPIHAVCAGGAPRQRRGGGVACRARRGGRPFPDPAVRGRAREGIAPARRRGSTPGRISGTHCAPSTTFCCIVPPKAVTPPCWRRCSPAVSIRTSGTRTA